LANGFAVEYLNGRIVQRLREAAAGARGTLAELRAEFGEMHPSVVRARTQLALSELRVDEQEKLVAERPNELIPLPGQTLSRAVPVWIPSGPNTTAILGLGLLGSLVAGVALALLMQRRDTGFHSEIGVMGGTGVRCVGMIPRSADGISADRRMERREAFRSLCLTTGLAEQAAVSRVVMVTSALPGQDNSGFIKGLADSLVENGRRVLIIDASPSSHAGNATNLDEVLENVDTLRQFLAEQADQPITELRRSAGLNGARNPYSSFDAAGRYFEQLLTEARQHYNVILINTPPVILFADSGFLGRFADYSFHVAIWNETPRASIAEAIRRLRDNMVRVDGIVLAEVDLGQYASYSNSDHPYYLGKYYKTPDAPSSHVQ
jgi:hypothetical protein